MPIQIKIAGETFSYTSQSENADTIVNDIRTTLEKKQLFLSHIIADGQEIYDNWEQFLLDHVDTLQIVSVSAVTLKTLIKENLASANQYLERAIPGVEILASKLYQSPTPEAWETFAELSDGIDWILQLLTTTGENLHLSQKWERIPALQMELKEALLSLQEAMDNEDIVLIADVLKYEIKSFFEHLQGEMITILGEEDITHDIV